MGTRFNCHHIEDLFKKPCFLRRKYRQFIEESSATKKTGICICRKWVRLYDLGLRPADRPKHALKRAKNTKGKAILNTFHSKCPHLFAHLVHYLSGYSFFILLNGCLVSHPFCRRFLSHLSPSTDCNLHCWPSWLNIIYFLNHLF